LGAQSRDVHRNVPGMLRRLNEVFLQRDAALDGTIRAWLVYQH
jgi:hypothetical protein